jgi:hypothetical protein
MAHSEACQLFIEQQIKEGLGEGKSAYAFAKELSAKIQQMFETAIPHSTLKDLALKMKRKIGGNPPTLSTPSNYYKIQEKPTNQEVNPKNPLAAQVGHRSMGNRLSPIHVQCKFRAITLHWRRIINDLV